MCHQFDIHMLKLRFGKLRRCREQLLDRLAGDGRTQVVSVTYLMNWSGRLRRGEGVEGEEGTVVRSPP